MADREEARRVIDQAIADELDSWPVPLSQLRPDEVDSLSEALGKAVAERLYEYPEDVQREILLLLIERRVDDERPGRES